jgi:hypothetical protein
MGCCGDTAAVTAKIVAARSLGFWEPGGFTLAKKNDSAAAEEAQVQENPYVQLEFVGPQVGSVTYMGLTGESYKAGNNEQDRIINALRADAEKLLNLRDEVGRPIFKAAGGEGEKLPKGKAAAVETAPAPAPAGGDILKDPAAAAATPNAGVVADIQAAENTAVADAVADADSAKSKSSK